MSDSIVTGEFRMSFPALFVKETKPDGTPGAYSVVAMIPKSDTATIQALNAGLKAEAERKFGKNLKGVKNPMKDGDKETYTNSDGVEMPKAPGYMLCRMSSNQKPGVVDANVQPVLDAEQAYAGRWACASVNFWSYANPQNKGVAVGLQNVQLLKDDEKLGSNTPKPQDVFKPVAITPAAGKAAAVETADWNA